MILDPGLVIAGKYRIEQQLAAGGMGSLWVTRHLQLDVPLAIKFMDPANAESPVAQQRFEREARALASVRSMHIVHIQDYGVTDGVPYIVMELLHGEDLGRRLRRMRRLPLAQASKILTQAAKGLRRAHEAGIVHRDLKPANIFLARTDTQDDDEIIKLLDFGVAKEMITAPVQGESTRTGELIGSPHYMSPEQIRGAKNLDYRSDLWSLGVIAFRSVTGALPFTGDSIGEVMAKIIADPIPIATQIAPELPPAINAFFDRAFARDREQRFQSARELADAFAMLSHEVVPTQWTGEFQRPIPTLPPGSAPPWNLSSLANIPRADHPAHEGEQSINYANSMNSWGRGTPPPGHAPSSSEFTPPPPFATQPGYGALTPGPGGLLGPTDGSFSATRGPRVRSLQWSPAWFGAVAGLAVIGLGFAFFALHRASVSAASEPAIRSVEAPSVTPSDSGAPSIAAPPPTVAAPLDAPAFVPSASSSSATAPASIATPSSAAPSAKPSAAASTTPTSTRQASPPNGGPRQPVVRSSPPPERAPTPPRASTTKKKAPSWGF